MTAHDRFFEEKKAAAVLKHGILQRYPAVFTAKTGTKSDHGRVVYLDGFAGPGRYESESEQTEGAEGSPLLAVRTATTVEAFRRTLHCVFVERNARHFENLRDNLKREAPPDMRYEVLQGDVTDHLDRVLTLARDSPLLAFLDPFGTGLSYSEMVGRLLGSRTPTWPPTEILLNFNLQSIWRIGGKLTAEPDSESARSREASLARVDEFLGDDWWREVFRAARIQAESQGEAATAARAAQQVALAYCERIKKDTEYRAFTVPVRREPGRSPLFMMILFYRYPGAPYVFNEAVSKANEEWRQFTHKRFVKRMIPEGEQHDLFDGMLVPELTAEKHERAETVLKQDWIDTIAANIRAMLLVNGKIGVQDNTEALYGDTLGLARELHLRKAWDQLSNQALVLPRIKKGKIANQIIRRA